MQKLIDETTKIVMDRFKNPYIVTFLISWTLFNWKPISFFIFSKGTVEYKINFISYHYSDILHYLILPLCSTILFLFILPYFNQANEWCIRWSIRHRANFAKDQIIEKIEREEKIAIAEEKKQKAISAAKESEDHNKFVEQLEEKIKILEQSLSDERNKNLELVRSHANDLKEANDFSKQIEDSKNELSRQFIELMKSLIIQIKLRNKHEGNNTHRLFVFNDNRVLEIMNNNIAHASIDYYDLSKNEKISNDDFLVRISRKEFKQEVIPMTSTEVSNILNSINIQE